MYLYYLNICNKYSLIINTNKYFKKGKKKKEENAKIKHRIIDKEQILLFS